MLWRQIIISRRGCHWDRTRDNQTVCRARLDVLQQHSRKKPSVLTDLAVAVQIKMTGGGDNAHILLSVVGYIYTYVYIYLPSIASDI